MATNCAGCGTALEIDALFCHSCGTFEVNLIGSNRFAEADAADGLPARYETKAQAIARVQGNANAEWLKAAKAAALRLAELRPTFTSDDIWEALEWEGVSTHEPKAMGAVLNSLGRQGLIRKTGRYVQTRRPIAHGRDVAEWTLA